MDVFVKFPSTATSVDMKIRSFANVFLASMQDAAMTFEGKKNTQEGIRASDKR